MASSSELSISHMGVDLVSGSKPFDEQLRYMVADVMLALIVETGVKIVDEEKLYLSELYQMFPEERAHHLMMRDKSYCIKPDGKVLLIEIDGVGRLPILIAEYKKQGDGKVQANGKAQAKGNAIERYSKYVMFMQPWMIKEDIMPLVCFCYGHDFAVGSYIVDSRLNTMNHCYPLNEIRVLKDVNGLGGQSIFHQVEPFTDDFIYETCYKIASASILYYLDKYKGAVMRDSDS